MIESDIALSVKLNNLIVNKEGQDIWIPLDDISIIVIDNLKISITMRTLCALSENNIAMVTCNQKHLPSGLFTDFDNHSRASKVLKYQLKKDIGYFDELWKEIIIKKIENQLSVLKILELNELSILEMKEFAGEVVSGDRTNREAHAAKVYFNTLMNNSFSRGNEDILLNSGLDYAYAIIRAYIARLCVGYGLNTQIGIHHKSEYNRFNLVDDLLEPVRPIVDLYAYKLLDGEEYFKPEHRRKLVDFLNHKIKYQEKKMFICNMLEEYVEQFASLIMERRTGISYPDVNNYLGGGDEV